MMHATVTEKVHSRQEHPAKGYAPKVLVVDSDVDSAKSMVDLARGRGLLVEQYNSGEAVWAALSHDVSGCAIVELELPGMSGIQLQERMAAARIALPVIMVAIETDATVAVRAMKMGAVDFLQKPCHPLELWEAIQSALEKDRVTWQEEGMRSRVRDCLQTLTRQEQLIMQMLLAGKPNKAIAQELDLSPRSIDFRRASILRKMQARSLVELAHMLTRSNHFAGATSDYRRHVH